MVILSTLSGSQNIPDGSQEPTYESLNSYSKKRTVKRVPDVSLQVISSHLFNQGFTMEFIIYLISSLQRDSKVTGKTATEVLLGIDRQIIDVSSFVHLWFQIKEYREKMSPQKWHFFGS